MSQQWEYCSLVSHADVDAAGTPGWRCRVTYFTPEGTSSRQLKAVAEGEPADVFERAMAQLGAGGWELVTLAHELVRNNECIQHPQYVAAVHTGYGFSAYGVAYFKRPVEHGRPIDAPPIAIVES